VLNAFIQTTPKEREVIINIYWLSLLEKVDDQKNYECSYGRIY